MEIEDGVKSLRTFLTVAERGIRFSDPFPEIVPYGWSQDESNLLWPIRAFMRGFEDKLVVNTFRINRGLIWFDITCEEADVRSLFWTVVGEKVCKKTAAICLVCGEKGRRRRQLDFWPSLCNPHYIQYFNWLDKHALFVA